MSKIVQAINSMIQNSDQITEVINGDEGELFFSYAGKHNWSIVSSNDGSIRLWLYLGGETLKKLAGFSQDDWQQYDGMVGYVDKDIGTREAKASFTELYSTVKEKFYGVDKVLDDIIKSDPLLK